MTDGDKAASRIRAAVASLLSLADRVERGTANRDEFDPVVAEILGAQREHFGPRPRAKRGEGGRAKLLAYFKEHVGEVLYGEQLSVIGGIGEWARRVRELRVQDGYDITELGGSSYRLENTAPDEERARLWRTVNEIRRRKGSADKRIEALFVALVGQVVTIEQIRYVAKIPTADRRTRELREKLGWPIDSHIDDKTLSPGEYRLISTNPADRLEPAQRLYGEKLRAEIFTRDNYTCQVCGRNREAAIAAGDTRFYLELHHKVALSDELAALPAAERDNPDNLVTLCHADHLKETAKLQRRKRGTRG